MTCPITLCIPESAVFMRNAADSNVCSIYARPIPFSAYIVSNISSTIR
ncbi:T3SS effector NleG family protein [Escherichia coli]|nr:T3SS effector NleG family protein [Escherichia coli]